MTRQHLLLFYFITTLGSCCTTVVCFTKIAPIFGILTLLGVALSLRTVGALIFSYNVNHLFHKYGVKNVFLASQIFGLFAVAVAYFGFEFRHFWIVTTGVVLTGIPGSLVSVGVISSIRSVTPDEKLFRRLSGSRELILGGSQIFAGLLVPVVAKYFSITPIFMFDFVTYLAAFLLISRVSLPNPSSETTFGPKSPNYVRLKDMRFLRFAFLVSAPLLLVGFLPILAGDVNSPHDFALPMLMRESLWSIEGLTMAFSSIAYIYLQSALRSKSLMSLLLLNALWVFFLSQTTSILLSLFF